MNDLADRVILANEEKLETQDGPELDDIGFPYPKVRNEKTMCEYLTARIIYLNKEIYQYQGLLWVHNRIIKETKDSYYTMAKYPKQISDPENRYVWRRLKEVVPTLNTDKVEVLPGVTFNMVTGEVKFEDVRTISSWDGKEK